MSLLVAMVDLESLKSVMIPSSETPYHTRKRSFYKKIRPLRYVCVPSLKVIRSKCILLLLVPCVLYVCTTYNSMMRSLSDVKIVMGRTGKLQGAADVVMVYDNSMSDLYGISSSIVQITPINARSNKSQPSSTGQDVPVIMQGNPILRAKPQLIDIINNALQSSQSSGGLKISKVDCNQPWVSSHIGGRLGNHMCEYAHLMLLHIEYGVQVGLRVPMHNALSKIFPNLSVQLLPEACLKDENVPVYSWPETDTLIHERKLNTSVITAGFPCDAGRLWRYRDIWRREFVFASEITYLAKRTIMSSLSHWKERSDLNMASQFPLVVGIHVRRTDYIPYLSRTTGDGVLQENYFLKALRYFRQKFNGSVVFLLTSDDRKWCQRMALRNSLNDVIITPYGEYTVDLALLSMSSHLIMSLGTYSFWAGILSRGLVLFPSKVGKDKEYFMTKNLRMINSSDLIPVFP